ncbi:hypothetical protein PsorP6_003435 [Peronosclerospora sorghi]|uniref:Uncharacterized protein n=1 Tax=Peronosclerospora sorghi TaxID=230839 RepID=A0ACC0VPS1_9STRA|nr:hypothetical protein PsorP6_003435 [Peronosclerospora sorghi]
MRLLTHNMLVCHVKACADTAGRETNARPLNFPLRRLTMSLKIVPEMDGIVVLETQYSKTFMLHIMRSIDYPALCQTTKELNHPDVPSLPENIPSDLSDQDELLKLIHRVIFDMDNSRSLFTGCRGWFLQTNIVEGEMVCNNCGRSYPISNAVPNMLLEEDEL